MPSTNEQRQNTSIAKKKIGKPTTQQYTLTYRRRIKKENVGDDELEWKIILCLVKTYDSIR